MQRGHKPGSTNKQGNNAGGQRKAAGRPKKPWLVPPEPNSTPAPTSSFSQVTGSFLKIILILLCLFSSYFKGRSALLPVDLLTKYTPFLIPDTLRIKYNFDGQAVEDPRTVSQNALNLVSIYPMRLHWSTLSGKRTNFYTYLATAQKIKYAVVPIHTEEEFHLFNSSVS